MTHDFRELCQKLDNYIKGKPPYDFSRLSYNDKSNAHFDALSTIMEEIRTALKDTENQPTDEFSSLADKIIKRVYSQLTPVDFHDLQHNTDKFLLKIISIVLSLKTMNDDTTLQNY